MIPRGEKLRGIFLSARSTQPPESEQYSSIKKLKVIDWRLVVDGTNSNALFLYLLLVEIFRLTPIVS
jgi:hypothetical protein